MRNHDLFSLSLFVAICETRSISRAAERMNIVASAASRRVGLLESALGGLCLVPLNDPWALRRLLSAFRRLRRRMPRRPG